MIHNIDATRFIIHLRFKVDCQIILADIELIHPLHYQLLGRKIDLSLFLTETEHVLEAGTSRQEQ